MQEYSTKDYPFLRNCIVQKVAPDGKLWIGTYGDGVVCFDGTKFTQISTKQGLLSTMVLDLLHTHDGASWIVGNQGFSRIKSESIRNYSYKALFPDIAFSEQHLLKYNANTKRLICCDVHLSRYYEFDFHKLEFIPIDPLTTFKKSEYYTLLAANDFNSFISYNNLHPDSTYLIRDSVYKLLLQSKDNVYHWQDSFLIYQSGNKLYKLNPKSNDQASLFYSSKYHILKVEPREKELYLIEYYNAKEFLITELNNEAKITSQFKLKSADRITSVVKDKAGNFWCAGNRGLFKAIAWVEELDDDHSNIPPSIWAINEDSKHRIWFSSERDGFRFLENGVIKTPLWKNQVVYALNSSLQDDYGNCYFSISNPCSVVKIKGPDKIEYIDSKEFVYFLSRFRSGEPVMGKSGGAGLWICTKNEMTNDHQDYIKIDSSKGLKLFNVLTASKDKLGNVWMGRISQGISVYITGRDSVINFLKKENEKIPGAISSCTDSRGNIWMGTDFGLVFIDVDRFVQSNYTLVSVLEYRFEEFIGNSTVGSLLCQDGKIYFGNQDGIGWFDENEVYGSSPQLHYFNRRAGYSGGGVEQNGMFIDHAKNLWVCNTLGVLKLSLEKYKEDSLRPELSFSKICSRDSCYNESKNLEFEIGTHSVQLYFDIGKSECLYDNVRLSYNLDDKGWIEGTDPGIILLQNLAQGTHQIRVKAIKKLNISSEEKSLSWLIKGHWWQNKTLWWLLTLIVIASNLFLIRILKRIIQKNKLLVTKETTILEQHNQLSQMHSREQQMLQDKMNLQVQAIVNQLNPHFLKNVLNWIQVKTISVPEATQVIGKLGANIEIIFRNSKERKPYHSLKDELTLVENYLFIQQTRYQEKLKFQVPDINEIINIENVQVPLLSILTHVENAAEHGIKNAVNGGRIIVQILQPNSDFIHIKIEDNGVGREAAKIAGSQGTQQGVNMLKQLIDIYNIHNSNKLQMWYEDEIYKDEQGRTHGTLVHWHIPMNYKYDL